MDDLQGWDDGGVWLGVFWPCSPSDPVSSTGTGFDSSPIKETFAKLSGTAIMCDDSQSPKLGFHCRFPPTRE